MDAPFDPFASGAAKPAAAVADGQKPDGFDPFASGLAKPAVEPGVGESFAKALPVTRTFQYFGDTIADTSTNWDSIYGGLDDLDKRLAPSQKQAFAALDRVGGDDPAEIRARAINQSFVGNWAKDPRAGVASNNWPAVKAAFAKEVLGVDLKDPSDKNLYSMIGARLKEDAAVRDEQQGTLKAWTWKDSIRGKLMTAVYGRYNLYYDRPGPSLKAFWESINKPIVALPEAPKNLPDVWIPGPFPTNPAVAGGVYNGMVKPIIEGIESPLGIATLGVGSKLQMLGKTYPLARKALAGMSGLFAASMAAATVSGTIEARRALSDPNATTQEKVRAVAEPVGTGLMALLAGMGTAFELMPKERAAAVSERLAGKTPSQAAEILRQEAVTESPEAASALNQAAGKLDELGRHEPPGAPKGVSDMPGQPIEEPSAAEPAPRQVGEERIAAAAIRKPDGTITEGYSHDAIKAELAEVPTLAKNEDGTWKVTSPDGAVELDGVTEAEARAASREMTGGADQPTTVQKVGEALAGAGAQEGFVTNTGRFVGRDEAARIAAEAGQLRAEETPGEAVAAKPAETPKELHSHQVEYDPAPEFPRSSFGQTALKNAYGELERVAYGFEEAPPTERRSMAERWERSREVMERNPEAGQQLAERLLANPNIGLTDDQSALLLRYKVGLQNALNEAADIAADATQSPELRAQANEQVGDLSNKLLGLLDAVNRRGSEWGREGRWRQAIAREDYSFASQETLLRAAKGGAELTEAERSALQDRIKVLEEAQAKYEAKIAELSAESRASAADRAVRDMSRPPRAPRQFRTAEKIRERLHTEADSAKKRLLAKLAQVNDITQVIVDSPAVLRDTAIIGADKLYSLGLDFAKWSAEMAADLGPKIQPALARIWEESKKLFHEENRRGLIDELKAISAEDLPRKLGPIARELARAKIEQGMKGRDEIVDAVWSDLKEAVPGTTRRDAMDAISGYGQFKTLTHDEITDALRDVKGQLQQVAKLEDMAAGQAPKKTGVERRSPSDEERALIKQVEEKKKEGGYEVADPETELKSALQREEARLSNAIADVERQLRLNEPFEPTKRPTPTNPKIEELKARLEDLKQQREYARESLQPDAEVRTAAEKRAAELDRRIAEVDKQLKTGEIFPKGKKAAPKFEDALVIEKEARLAELKRQRQYLRESLQPRAEPMDPQQRALATVKGNLRRQIESLEKQIETRTRDAKGRARTALDADAERLRARRDELKKEFDLIFGRREMTPEQRLNIWKAAARRRLAELEERLAAKDFEARARKPVPMDEEAYRLKAAVERARQDFAIERQKAIEEALPRWQKAMNTTAGIARASALSGYHTLAKLGMFSLYKFAEAPVYETLSAGLRRLPGLGKVAAKANLEAGAEFEGLAKFYAKAATDGIRDAWQTIRTGKSDLKAELGNPRHNERPVHWWDYFGLSHMTEKSPLLRGDFELRLEKATQSALANGLDVTDPMVQAALRKEAFDYAQRAILQENNTLASWVRNLEHTLERVNPKTGKVDIQKATLSWFIKTFLTKGIVRTPANYVAQTIARTPFGLAKGTAQLVVAHMNGVDKLTPDEANAIMRLLKLGAVGTAVFVWGAIDASKDPKDRIFGGYYQPGDKRSGDDVGFGRIRVGGWEMPQLLTHNPLTESAQMGSTFYRVMKQKVKRRGEGGTKTEEKGAVAGAATALVSLASEAPVMSPITRQVSELERGEGGRIIWNELSGLVPMFIQNLARDLDDNRSRKPESFGHSFEQYIPVLRQNVPETKTQKARDIKERLKKRQEEKK